jgi:hypothetical protein
LNLPWYKDDAAEWLLDLRMRYLTAEQRGYVAQLRAEMWLAPVRATLTNDGNLWRLAGAESPERFKETGAAALEMFRIEGDLIYCPMLLKQAGDLAQMISDRSKGGKISAARRKAKQEQELNSSSTAVEQEPTEKMRFKRLEKENKRTRTPSAPLGKPNWGEDKAKFPSVAEQLSKALPRVPGTTPTADDWEARKAQEKEKAKIAEQLFEGAKAEATATAGEQL